MEIETLRDLARRKLRLDQLPRELPTRVWGGPGLGHQCTVCEQPVTSADVELELQFFENGHPYTVRMHTRCFAATPLAWHYHAAAVLSRPGKGGADAGAICADCRVDP
jgi:hypothetical protein